MAGTTMTVELMEQAVYGGAILGGGGGGWIQDGLQKGKLALEIGEVNLITVDQLADEDFVTCVSLVGAPAAKNQYVSAKQLYSTVNLLQQNFHSTIKALMTNENGAATTVNGWIQAALTGLPVIDAPCNGRAHPTASMGSMNLSELENFISYQAAAGGKGTYEISGYVTGSIQHTSNLIRQMSVEAGGMVGVARNPVQTGYIKENAAVGGISQAIALGEVFLQEKDPLNKIEAVATKLQGRVIKVGQTHGYSIETKGGFDVGKLYVDDLELTFWNEYMTAEENGNRKGTFPDLLMTFDTETGLPVVSAEIENDRKIAVISVPKEHLLLSTTMSNNKLLKTVESVVNKQILFN
ncbi:DUF917 family protein [Evansella vedderi]|uniref:DUF917 family protein n=1 Tax=Evansella vedderi TaxID=38282 RepID=A0ABT9ZPC6_9BACI|nr:DUF917 family protein [Evansella vedderi]MDQ0252800.1 DUF917 family protein [Evansella vedderi]